MRDEEDGGKVLASCDTCNGAGDVSEECTENLEDLHRKTTGYVFGMFFAQTLKGNSTCTDFLDPTYDDYLLNFRANIVFSEWSNVCWVVDWDED